MSINPVIITANDSFINFSEALNYTSKDFYLIIINYVNRYDFRLVLSYHNRGEVIYWSKWFALDEINHKASNYAQIATSLSGYSMITGSDEITGKGYLSDYVNSNLLKPTITLETLPYSVDLPNIPVSLIEEAYTKTYLVPYYLMEEAINNGYYKHKLYINDRYVRDFSNLEYATAYAKKYNGKILSYNGYPMEYNVFNLTD